MHESFAELTQLHPERLFSQLLALSGELATLVGNERRPAPLPAYNHDALEACFAPLIRDIRRALATVLEQNAIQIPLHDRQYGVRVALIPFFMVFLLLNIGGGPADERQTLYALRWADEMAHQLNLVSGCTCERCQGRPAPAEGRNQ